MSGRREQMGQGLQGVKVLELAAGVAAALAGKLMADLGAEVVKIEPPGGDPARQRGPFRGGAPDPEASGLYLALNANKRSLELDLCGEAGQSALEELAGRTQLLIHDHPPARMQGLGLDYARFAALNPGLVMLSITPFGLDGPYSAYQAAELNLIHASGWGYNCPGPGMDPALPPIKPFGQHACIQAGLHGATAAMATLYGVLQGGPGEHIDLSVQEAALTCLGRHMVNYTYAGAIDSRLRERAYAPNGFYPCKDGIIYLVTIEEDQWQRLLELMGNPAWAQDERFQTKFKRAQVEEELNPHLEAFFAQWCVDDLYRACQERRICVAPVYGYDQLLADPHLQARGFVQAQTHPVAGALPMPGAPYLLKVPWWSLRSPAPRLGEANNCIDELLQGNGGTAATGGAPCIDPSARAGAQAPLPLQGVRVLDFTWVWAGPHGAMMLANLGAEVLKVESPDRPDLLRRSAIIPTGMQPGINRAGTFNQMGQGKKSVGVDLSHPGGLALVKRLAAECDVVISNFSTGVMDRFGLGAADLHRINPELIVAAISGFGQTGPCKDFIGYGQAIVPLSGISAQTGYEGQGPSEVATAYGDPNAGITMAYGVVAALAARAMHGGGQYLDISLWEAMAASGFEGWMNHALGNPPHLPMGNRDPVWAPHNCYRCAGEDNWISIAVTEEAHWQALCREMDNDILPENDRFRTAQARKANEGVLDEIISAWCAPRERWELTRRLQDAGVPAFPSLSTKDLAEDPHLHARSYFGHAPHPEVGELLHTGLPWRMRNRPSGVIGPAPLLGEHTDEVLNDVLGLEGEEIARLRAEGVLG
ncbi:MAG: CoA transferase [SAR324 cluster bacterium]|nr:CoA transferase [SAR324 cluster bacterium]